MAENRKIVISSAAQAIITILERRGLNVALTGDLAIYLHGGLMVPKKITAIIQENPDGSPPDVYSILLNEDPAHFRFGGVGNRSFRFYDLTGAIPERKQNWRNLEFTVVHKDAPVFKQPGHVSRVQGLPAVGLLPTISNLARELVQSCIGNSQPSKKQINQFREALTVTSVAIVVPLDDAFNEEAWAILEQLSTLTPQFSTYLARLIRIFKKPVTSAASIPVLSAELPLTARLSDNFIQSTGGNQVFQAVEVFDRPTRIEADDSQNLQAGTDSNHRKEEAICDIAKDLTDILNQLGVPCALFGNLACYLYGNERTPNNIDILIFPPPHMTPELYKEAIFNVDNNRFSLEMPKAPQAGYKVLYYHVDESDAPLGTFHGNKCKIDILTPGTMHLPSLSEDQIEWYGGLPVVPFPVLLLQKLQGWDDHRRMQNEPRKYAKRLTDARDVQDLLALEEHVDALRQSGPDQWPWKNRDVFSEEFERLSRIRVRDFCAFYPKTRDMFRALGLVV